MIHIIHVTFFSGFSTILRWEISRFKLWARRPILLTISFTGRPTVKIFLWKLVRISCSTMPLCALCPPWKTCSLIVFFHGKASHQTPDTNAFLSGQANVTSAVSLSRSSHSNTLRCPYMNLLLCKVSDTRLRRARKGKKGNMMAWRKEKVGKQGKLLGGVASHLQRN